VSIVIPCLNEEEAVESVVRAAWEGLEAAELEGEVIVVDNASDDRSAALAAEAGAEVVSEPRRGYGSAYLAGFRAARGRYIVMADADATYDLRALDQFVERLRDGADLVLGSRFRGRILPGAMPWSHRLLGNPVLTWMLRLMFGSSVSDAHCGFRAVRRDVIGPLRLSATGMEFASEMVIKAAKRGLRVAEVPIVYYPRRGDSKLNSFRDAWRHIRFMLVHSATHLFLIPGVLAVTAGLASLSVLAALGAGDSGWEAFGAVAAGLLAVVGGQLIQLGLFAKTYAVVYLGESEPVLERLWQRFHLEHGLLAGALLLVVGFALVLGVLVSWLAGRGALEHAGVGMLGLTLGALGLQAAFGSFFLSVLGLSEHAVLRRRGAAGEE
jgi:hypothetical protein